MGLTYLLNDVAQCTTIQAFLHEYPARILRVEHAQLEGLYALGLDHSHRLPSTEAREIYLRTSLMKGNKRRHKLRWLDRDRGQRLAKSGMETSEPPGIS